MLKKVSVFFTSLFIIGNIFNYSVKGKSPTDSVKAPYTSARAAIAIDSKSKIVLYEKNSSLIVPMASTTKIITSLVALKYGNLDKKVEISEKSASIRGSTVGYRKGEEISLHELLFGLMLRSGNDAAIAIAEGVSGSVEEFCKLMTEFSHELGLVNSHFETPHGLDAENHYTTAYDLALVTTKAKEIQKFNEIVSTRDIDAGKYGFTRSYHNINKILWQLPEANGVKTGYTGQAGKCLVTSVKYQNNEIIIVVLNCTERWAETKKIFNYIVSQYEYRNVASKDEVLSSLSLKKSRNKINLKCSEDVIIPVNKSSNLDKRIAVPDNLPSELNAGDRFGSLQVYENETMLYSAPLICDSGTVKKQKLSDFFKNLIH